LSEGYAVQFDNLDSGDPLGDRVEITDIETMRLAVAEAGILLDDGSPNFAWISYDGSAKELSVRLSKIDSRPSSPLLSASIDLASLDPQGAYVGLTAAYGAISGLHSVLEWDMVFMGLAAPLDCVE